MKIFGIRNKSTKLPLGISTFSNAGAECCNEVGAKFETTYIDAVYAVADESSAIGALKENPNWFNASLLHPEWPRGFNPKEYEVFALNL